MCSQILDLVPKTNVTLIYIFNLLTGDARLEHDLLHGSRRSKPHHAGRIFILFFCSTNRVCLLSTTPSKVEGRAYLKRVGFDVGEDQYFAACSTEEQIDASVDTVEGARDAMRFDIDGVVIKINNLRQRDILGSTTSSPRWARALKFDPEQAETRVISISVQVGRTGQVTPVKPLEYHCATIVTPLSPL